MRKIRNKIFETNSSSSHSLIIENKENQITHSYSEFNLRPNNEGYIQLSFGEFGWGYETLRNQEDKLSYLLTMAMETELKAVEKPTSKSYDVEKRFRKTDGFKKLDDFVKKHCYCKGIEITSSMELMYYTKDKKLWLDIDGYIDHQSYENYKSMQDFLDYYKLTIDDVVLNDNIKIKISNDNQYDYQKES